jgi:hypothetical protein
MLESSKSKKIKRAVWNFRLGLFTFILFVAVMTINYFREELFGIVPGYAPHNFSFNLTFFIPANFFILICCLVVIIRTLFNWNKWSEARKRFWSLILTIPIILLWVVQIIRIASY